MSWLYSRALAEEYSAGLSSDGEPSAPSKSNHIPQAYLSNDRMTAFSRLSQFGMTFAPLTESLGAELLTWYLAGFPVRTSAPQEKALGLPENDQDSGKNMPGLLAKYDLDSSSWKTVQCSLFEDLEPSSVIFPRWGIMLDGELYPLPTPELRTCGKESGLWLIPTPCTAPEAPNHGSNSNGPHNLLEVAKTGWKPGMMWPTPTGHDGRDNASGGALKRKSPGLGALAQVYATPQARDFRTGQASRWEDPNRTRNLNDQIGGQLNPTWVEWLMEWPLGWTDLKPLETDKFQTWLGLHGISFAEKARHESK